MTGWPISLEIDSARMRATTSIMPPAGAGTIIFTGLFVQAWASGAAATASAATSAFRRNLEIFFIMVVFVVVSALRIRRPLCR